MLSPVSAVSTAGTAPVQRDVPVVAQQALATLASTPDAAVALSLAANSEVEGKLNMLLIGARERLIDSLFAVVDAVSQSLAMQPAAGESNIGYALRLAGVVNNLQPSQVAAVQQQLNTQGQTAPLALIARALQNPAGNEAAQVVAYMEVVRYKEKDLATKAVVASYGQNGGTAEPEAETAPTTTVVIAPAGNGAQGAASGQSKLPIPAGSTVPTTPVPQASSEAPAEAAGVQKPTVYTPSPLTGPPSQQAATAAQTAPVPAKLPSATTTSEAPQAAAPLPEPETPVPVTTGAPHSETPSLPAETPKQTTVPPMVLSPALREEQAATFAQPPAPANVNQQDVSRPTANTPSAAPSPGAPQVPTSNPSSMNTTSAPQPRPAQPQAQATYQPLPLAVQAFVEAVELLPVTTVPEEEVQSLPQDLPQMAGTEDATASPSPSPSPLLPQPQAAPATDPLRSVVSGAVPQDVQAVLKVVVDRLVGATGVELLQTMAEVEPVVEKVVAQALVADMLDSAELGTLPSPDDAALPAQAARIQQSAAMVAESPVAELASLVALNRMLAEGAPVVQAMVQQQPLQPPLPLGVPFAIGQYLAAEDAAEESEALHIDRVDAVDDEENDKQGSGRQRDADEEAADEQPENHQEHSATSEPLETGVTASQAFGPAAYRPLALPRPAPMEPMGATAFNLYQRMGDWD